MQTLNKIRKTKSFNLTGCHVAQLARATECLTKNGYSIIAVAGSANELNLFTFRVLKQNALIDLRVKVSASVIYGDVEILESETIVEAV